MGVYGPGSGPNGRPPPLYERRVRGTQTKNKAGCGRVEEKYLLLGYGDSISPCYGERMSRIIVNERGAARFEKEMPGAREQEEQEEQEARAARAARELKKQEVRERRAARALEEQEERLWAALERKREVRERRERREARSREEVERVYRGQEWERQRVPEWRDPFVVLVSLGIALLLAAAIS